jgi:DinB superfamily
MTEARTPTEPAEQIAAARDRLVDFAAACTDEVWYARPLAASGDDRCVGVIVDHVADSYDYASGWIRQLLAGQDPGVTAAMVDGLNAAHAERSAHLTQAGTIDHLETSGDAMIALISGLSETDLDAGGGMVRTFALIAERHPDNHRAELETALEG